MQNIYTIKSRLAELREELMNHAAAWILTYNNEHGLMNWLTSQVKDN